MTPEKNAVIDDNENLLWFAMSATYGRELMAKEFLEKHNVQCFVPMRYVVAKDKSQKSIKKLVPAISNLIFVHTTRDIIQDLKTGVNYLHYHTMPVGERRVPITVPEYQMQQFITVCNTLSDHLQYLSPDEVNLQEGTPVKVVGGTLDGVIGTFVRLEKGKRKKVVILAQNIAAVVLTKITDGYIQAIND